VKLLYANGGGNFSAAVFFIWKTASAAAKKLVETVLLCACVPLLFN
jgi:hypothetical protein